MKAFFYEASNVKHRSRFAPSPTGYLHIGNALSALAAWLSIRSKGGTFIWRVEDLDGPRSVHGMDKAAMEDLTWLGLDWDEGPDVSGPHTPYYQSERTQFYETALIELADKDLLFPCRLSRKDLASLASAPDDRDRTPPYPASLRPQAPGDNWMKDIFDNPDSYTAIRFKVDHQSVSFNDHVFGSFSERLDKTVGDFVLKRRDGLYAYQLAVVVDDILMNVTEVVRGADLLSSTARQIRLFESLGGQPPAFGHIPLVVNSRGEKLSKRDAGLTLCSLREKGVEPEQLTGYFGYILGFLGSYRPYPAEELIPLFSWDKIPRNTCGIPDNFEEKLCLPFD